MRLRPALQHRPRGGGRPRLRGTDGRGLLPLLRHPEDSQREPRWPADRRRQLAGDAAVEALRGHGRRLPPHTLPDAHRPRAAGPGQQPGQSPPGRNLGTRLLPRSQLPQGPVRAAAARGRATEEDVEGGRGGGAGRGERSRLDPVADLRFRLHARAVVRGRGVCPQLRHMVQNQDRQQAFRGGGANGADVEAQREGGGHAAGNHVAAAAGRQHGGIMRVCCACAARVLAHLASR